MQCGQWSAFSIRRTRLSSQSICDLRFPERRAPRGSDPVAAGAIDCSSESTALAARVPSATCALHSTLLCSQRSRARVSYLREQHCYSSCAASVFGRTKRVAQRFGLGSARLGRLEPLANAQTEERSAQYGEERRGEERTRAESRIRTLAVVQPYTCARNGDREENEYEYVA